MYSVWDRLRHIHEAPLKYLRRSLWWLRKTFFTRPRSDTDAFLVERTKPDLVDLFGRAHFEPGWELSYHYRGEILNLRRVVYDDDRDPYEWWQVHIRGYRHDGGTELTAHYETDPSEHPDAHVDMVGLDVERGLEAVADVLDAHGVEYTRLETPGDDGG